jgi:hypothetical protein
VKARVSSILVVAVAVTFLPSGATPVAVALFVNPAVTFVCTQV